MLTFAKGDQKIPIIEHEGREATRGSLGYWLSMPEIITDRRFDNVLQPSLIRDQTLEPTGCHLKVAQQEMCQASGDLLFSCIGQGKLCAFHPAKYMAQASPRAMQRLV